MREESTDSRSKIMRKTCVLVDDDDDKEIFSLALTEANPSIECISDSDGPEAVSLLRDGSFIPGYISLDLNMPIKHKRYGKASTRLRGNFQRRS